MAVRKGMRMKCQIDREGRLVQGATRCVISKRLRVRIGRIKDR